MQRFVSLTLALGLIMASALTAGASTITWDGITWGVDNNTAAVDGGGNLVLTADGSTNYHTGNDGYGAMVGVYPYSGNVPGQSHATWDPGTFTTQWFQATFIDSGAGVGAAPYIMVEQNVPYRGLYISTDPVGGSGVSYTGSPDGGTNWYEGSLYSRTAGTHTLAFLLTAADSSLKAYYDGSLAATISSGFGDLEHIYLGSFGASGQTLTYTDFQLGTNGLPPSIPEPGTLVLLGTAGLGMLAYTWRRRRS